MSAYLSSRASNETTMCQEEFEKIIAGALQFDSWALKIIDAWGKPLPSGLLRGNVFWTGNYDECVQPMYLVDNKSFVAQPFDTQHCTLFPISSTTTDLLEIFNGITLGMCVPSSCDRQSVALLIQSFFTFSNITEDYLDCSNDPPNGQKNFTGGAIATCIILSLLGLLVLIGTVIDLIITVRLKSDQNLVRHDSRPDIETLEMKSMTTPHYSDLIQRPLLEPTPRRIFLANFSALRTLRRIFTMEKKEDENSFAFINGLRVLSLFWVIIGHSVLDSLAYTSNVVDVLSWTKNIFFQLIINATFTVDTFFVISGFLTTIAFVRQVKKEKLSFRLMVLYYVHRYIRLTPAFLLLLSVSINLTPYFGHGPFYPTQKGFEPEACRNHYWWTSIFYIGNLIEPSQMCFTISWYLFNDMQFYWIAPLALIPFVKGRKWIAFTMTIIFVLVGIMSILGILLHYPNMTVNSFDEFQFAPGTNFFNTIYVTPWCRISAYAIGLLTGFLLITMGRTYRFNVYSKLIGTLLAIAICLTCLFSVYREYANEPGLSRASLVTYQCLSRTGWALAIGWLIFLCSSNQGGIVNTILSWPIWLPFARLNYAAFLVHPTILYIIIFNRTVPFYYQPHILVNNLVSHIFFSYVAAIVVNIFFETPFVVIEKKLLNPRGKNKIVNVKD
ncbi:unnamed protein product [Adineta steineri]|uniref:Nose resistant-to-fluoxetine protein N-terminal domain-containing protein n=1 Tax=Adineta steineri TaxID=433720 RepID=A0A814N7S5_9BILA|nr:unnamed protein product [Adineta steineri]